LRKNKDMRLFKFITTYIIFSIGFLGIVYSAEEANTDEAGKKQLEIEEKKKELEKAEKKVDFYSQELNLLGEKKVTLETMVDNLDSEIASIESSLLETERSLMETQRALNEKEHEIFLKEDEIVKKKDFLGKYVRTLNSLDKKTLVEVLLEKKRLSDYFHEIEAVFTFQRRLEGMLKELNDAKQVLSNEKQELKEIEGKQLSLKSMQDQQRLVVEVNKRKKEKLLVETQGEETKFEELYLKGSKDVSKLTAELTALQSLGTAISFESAVRTAKEVEKLTGVRAAFLLGVLKVESNMGNNVGGGRYKTDMSPKQWDNFKKVCKGLGYKPSEMPVSKKPCYRNKKGECTGWGGAMGPAQFMPSTWMGYKDEVAKITGNSPANPWNLTDALTAMGLKLAKVPGVTDQKEKYEKKAASIYLAGGNWENFGWYGDRVLGFAEGYEEVLK